MPPKAKPVRKQPARGKKANPTPPEAEQASTATAEPAKVKKTKIDPEIQINSGTFVAENKSALGSQYTIRQVLGEGSFGRVSIATHKVTKQKRAIKTILKENLSEEALADFLGEVEILKTMDNPHILKVYEYFEEEDCFHLVKSEFISERMVSQIMDQLLRAINYCHTRNIVHRDLKPENIMLESRPTSEDDSLYLKVIDFGLAALLKPGTRLQDEVGTTDFMSPQVVDEGKYTEKCDIWSCGVILYSLLVGSPPFESKTESRLVKEILRGEVSFDSDEWQQVSDDARDLCEKMLAYKENDRLSAEDCLLHPFLVNSESQQRTNAFSFRGSLQNLKKFRANSKFQKAVMSFITSQLMSKRDIARLTKQFQAIDTNGDGQLSREELLTGYTGIGSKKKAQEEVQLILESSDLDASDHIDYSEFLLAAVNRQKLLSKRNLQTAFEFFDADNSGTITSDELRKILGAESEEANWEALIAEIDSNFDGEIDLKEFSNLILQVV